MTWCYFAEVVDRGGFAAAGRALGMPKSRLSRRVAELEARLGVRLLQRTTRKLSLTEAGEQYHRHCAAMREEAEAAPTRWPRCRTEPRGTIRVACPVTLAQTTLGPVLPQFLARYPQVRIDMRVSNRVVDLVEEGVDVALRVRPRWTTAAAWWSRTWAQPHPAGGQPGAAGRQGLFG
jgi:DNA-binding transcriptional LysR family regulator